MWAAIVRYDEADYEGTGVCAATAETQEEAIRKAWSAFVAIVVQDGLQPSDAQRYREDGAVRVYSAPLL